MIPKPTLPIKSLDLPILAEFGGAIQNVVVAVRSARQLRVLRL